MVRKSGFVVMSLVIAAVMLFGLVNNLQVGAQEGPKYGGTLVSSCALEPTTGLLALTTDERSYFCFSNVYAGLVQYDMNLIPHPWLAESWDTSSDGLVWTFNIVHNATFHDGVPVTSADVQFSVLNVSLPYNPWATKVFSYIDTVETTDNYTVVFKLKTVCPVFLAGFAPKRFTVVAKHLYEGTDILSNPYNMAPIGCGPFMFSEWVHGDHVTLVRNPNYFRSPLPYLDKIITKIVNAWAATVTLLDTGAIDYIPVYTPAEEVGRLRWNTNYNFSNAEYSAVQSMRFVSFNMDPKNTSPIQDINVRKAIAHAINPNLHITKAEYSNAMECAGSIFSPMTFAWNPSPSTTYPYNVTLANQILDNAGYPRGSDGVRFHLHAPVNQLEYIARNMDLLAIELKEIGIVLDVEYRQSVVNAQLTHREKDYDITVDAYEVGPDPIIGGDRLYLSTRISNVSTYCNLASFNNSRVDQLADIAGKTMNATLRRECYYEINEIILEKLSYFGIFGAAYVSTWRNTFQGMPVGPYGFTDPADKVWWTLAAGAVTEEGASGIPLEILVPVIVAVVAIAGVGVYAYARRRRK